jgi:hypothetical protein
MLPALRVQPVKLSLAARHALRPNGARETSQGFAVRVTSGLARLD